jgi:hypothetical protein
MISGRYRLVVIVAAVILCMIAFGLSWWFLPQMPWKKY